MTRTAYHRQESPILPCQTCDGEGQTYTSRYGGNDPNGWTVTCEDCGGSGNQRCDDCGMEPARVAVKGRRGDRFLCVGCRNELAGLTVPVFREAAE